MDFDSLLRRVRAAIVVLGHDPATRDQIHERVIRDGASEEMFFFAWQAALIMEED